MKIAIVGTFPPFRGGIAHFNSILARNLSLSHEVRAYNFTTQYPAILFPGKTQFESGPAALDFPSRRILSTISPLSWKRTAQAIIEFGPDLILYKYWMPFFAPAFGAVTRYIKKTMECKVTVICDNVIPHERRIIDIPFTRYFFKYVDRFVVMSKSVEEDLLSLFPNAEYVNSPHPLYNIFGDSIDRVTARNKLGLDKKKVILFFGFVRKYKGLDLLLEAAAILKENLDDFVVLAAGESYEDSNIYSKIVDELDIRDVVDLRIEFIPDSAVHLYFSAADVVVLPYRTATQSGIVPIAYSFDRPVIVTKAGGLPEIVEEGKTGFLCEGNPDSIAATVKKFYDMRDKHNFQDSIKVYKQNFSWQEFSSRVISELN